MSLTHEEAAMVGGSDLADWAPCARCRHWLMVEKMKHHEGQRFCALCAPGGSNE